MRGVTVDGLYEFVHESNSIEGIRRPPLLKEINALERFIQLPEVTCLDLTMLVSVFQSDARLREHEGMDVRVGNHVPPPGGPDIPRALDKILLGVGHPYWTHHAYETLHPFTDGNGRSGRALWLWGMDQRGELDQALGLGFLHCWYYQSLELGGAR